MADKQSVAPKTPNAVAHFAHQVLTMDDFSMETVSYFVSTLSVKNRMRFIERCTSLANSIADREARRPE
jgi:hypothetical protein